MLVTIITDASYCSTTKAGGYGYWIASARGKLGGGGGLKGQVRSSLVAEMMAISNSLHQAIKNELVHILDEVLIQTDCIGAIHSYEGSRNSDLSEQEIRCIEWFEKTVEDNSLTVEFRHVKGHSGKLDARSVTNKLCDKRAKKAMQKVRMNRIKENLNKGYNLL